MSPKKILELKERKCELLKELIEIERKLSNPIDNYFGSNLSRLESMIQNLKDV